jgi:cytochrome c peroxidase
VNFDDCSAAQISRGWRWLKPSVLLACALLALINLAGWARDAAAQERKPSPSIRLGVRLFMDARFSTPQGDLRSSCSDCHLFDEDPQGLRGFVDFLARSWVPWRMQDPRRDGLRNAPTLFDVAQMPRLHFDGEFGSLEELVSGTLSGRPMGWLPGEEPQAFAQVHSVLVNDRGEGRGAEGSYREQFKQVYGVELEKLRPDETVNLVAKAMTEFMRTLKTERASPYDQFIRANGLAAEPALREESKTFAARLLAQVMALEAGGKLKLTRGFDAAALRGFKIFFRTEGAGSTGNCAACHAPPLFTDFSFHNLGVSQREYDRIHGEGKFAALPIPDAATAVRPAARFRETPRAAKPGETDLGYWNFVDLSASPLRRPGESDDQFLRRLIATFKTPTLRNLAYSYPYLHTGAFSSLEETLGELMRVSELARAGRVREADPELMRIRITEADIPALTAFLNTLNEDLKRLRPAGLARN